MEETPSSSFWAMSPGRMPLAFRAFILSACWRALGGRPLRFVALNWPASFLLLVRGKRWHLMDKQAPASESRGKWTDDGPGTKRSGPLGILSAGGRGGIDPGQGPGGNLPVCGR